RPLAARLMRYSGRSRCRLGSTAPVTHSAPRRVRPLGRLKTLPGSHQKPRLAGGWPTTPAQRVFVCGFTASGPRGIRTLDLLNAIETRSQLRYGPKQFSFAGSVAGGPGGIRTLDLLSAIEARSQLRYRPASEANCT